MKGIRGKRLGEVLTSMGIITKRQLREVLSVQKLISLPIGKILISLGYTDEDVILALLGKVFDAPFIRPSELEDLDHSLLNTLPKELVLKELVLPLRKEENSLVVAMADPQNVELKQKLEDIFGMSIKPCIASEKDIRAVAERFHVGNA